MRLPATESGCKATGEHQHARGSSEVGRKALAGDGLLVAAPHAQDVDSTLVGDYLIDESVLDVDAPGVAPGEIANELLVPRWSGEGVRAEQLGRGGVDDELQHPDQLE